MVAFDGVDDTMMAEARNLTAECSCCLPCGMTCNAYGSVSVGWSDSADPPVNASGVLSNGTFTFTTTCCPEINAPLTGHTSVVDIEFVAFGYPLSGSCDDAPDSGDGKKFCSVDIGIFTAISQARLLFDFPSSALTCTETDPEQVLGIDAKTYVYEFDTLTVTLTVSPFGAVERESCTPAWEGCYSWP